MKLSLSLLLLFSFSLSSAAADVAACSRACLLGLLDQYLNAHARHEPSRAPLAKTFRGTENGIDVREGEGLWRSFQRLGELQRRYADTTNAQVAYFGTIEELSASALVMLRIKVANQQITESEWIVARPGEPLFSLSGAIADAPPQAPLASHLRSERGRMIAAANSYFEGLQRHQGAGVLAHEGCVRVENGTMVTSRPGPSPSGANSAPAPPSGASAIEFERGDCDTNLERMTQIAAVVNRRYPVVDTDAGVVVGLAIFNRPAGALRRDGTPWPRLLLAEIFSIETGRVRGIYASMHYLPSQDASSGWSD